MGAIESSSPSPSNGEGDEGHEDGKGLDQEQARQGCQQEAERPGEEEPVDPCSQEGPCCPEDQGLRRDQEGYAPLPQGEGVLQSVNTSSRRLEQVEQVNAPAPAVGISAAV